MASPIPSFCFRPIFEPIDSPSSLELLHRRSTKKDLLQAIRSIECSTPIEEAQFQNIYECIRRVDGAELRSLFEEAVALHKLTESEQEALLSLDWRHRVFDSEYIPQYALLFFASGQIEGNTMSEILIHHACKKEGGRSIPFCLPNGAITEEAEALLDRMIPHQYIKAKSLKTFVQRILPKYRNFQLHLFHIPLNSPNVASAISNRIQFTLFSERSEKETHFILMAPQLIEELFRLEFKDGAAAANGNLKLNPVLGDSLAPANFQHLDRRDIRIPCSLFSQKMEADSHKATPLTFYFHDIYHAYLDASNHNRGGWIELSRLLNPKTSPLLKRVDSDLLAQFCFEALDREFPVYRMKEMKKEELFWVVLFSHPFLIQDIETKRDQYKEIYKTIFFEIDSNPRRWNDWGISPNFREIIVSLSEKNRLEKSDYYLAIPEQSIALALECLEETKK